MPLLNAALNHAQRLVPSRFDLVFNSIKGRIVGSGEPESRQLGRLSQGFRTAIDIGANRGEYTLQMSRLFNSVWSFEPNEDVSRPIRDAKLQNVHLMHYALSSTEGTASMSVPIANGIEHHGLGSLDLHDRSDANKRFEVPLRALDSFNISDVDFIKIDVEGHELNTLNGGIETLDRCRPICLVEFVGDHQDELTAFFSARGYEAHQLWNGVRVSDHNRIFAPRV